MSDKTKKRTFPLFFIPSRINLLITTLSINNNLRQEKKYFIFFPCFFPDLKQGTGTPYCKTGTPYCKTGTPYCTLYSWTSFKG